MAKRLLQFLNVDLEIESRVSLEPLVAALGGAIVVLASFRHRGVHTVNLELSRSPKSAASAMRSFAKLVRGLPPPARKIWQQARRRDFDAGFALGAQAGVVAFEVPPEVARVVSGVGGRIVLTLYPQAGARRPGDRASRTSLARVG